MREATHSHTHKHTPPRGRDSGNDFCFPDFASHTGNFRLIFVRISSVVSFRVNIRQLHAARIYEIQPSKNETQFSTISA